MAKDELASLPDRPYLAFMTLPLDESGPAVTRPIRIGRFNTAGFLTLYQRETKRFLKILGQTVAAPMMTAVLFMAGVGNALIDDAISSHDEDEGDDAETVAAIIYARRRRLGPFARQDNLKDGWKDRHLGSLARAGFSISVARFVLNFDDPASAEDWLNNPKSR